MKSIFINLLLIISGPLFLFLLIESGFRIQAIVARNMSSSLEEQLKHSEEAEPVQDIGTQAIGGLIKASAFPDVVYELKPNISGKFQGKPFLFNSKGMRDREYDLTKPRGTVRIVGIGDSVMFGWGVEEAECYLRVIEKKLSEKYATPTVEIMNFAVPGYNTSMEIAAFEKKALAYNPDLVIIHFVENDFDVPLFMQRPRVITDLTHSLFINFVKERLANLNDSEPKENNLLASRSVNNRSTSRYEVLDQYKETTGEMGFRRALKKLSIITSERKIPVIVVIGGAEGQMKRVVKRATKTLGFHLLEIRPFVDQYVKSNQLENTSKARKKLLAVSQTDNHPNSLGHSIYAEAIGSKIIEIAPWEWQARN